MKIQTGDSIVDSVIEKFIERSLVGQKKYGTTLDRDDFSLEDWIVSVTEELMDATIYLTKLKSEISKKINPENLEITNY